MRAHYQILWPLFSLFLVRVDLTDLVPMRMKVQVFKVYDGDTLLVGRGDFRAKVRLARIDAPEKGQPFINQSGDAGAASKKCLLRHLKKEGVLIVYGFDIYGRMLGDVDGLNFNLVQNGCAGLYPYAKFSDPHEKFVYLRALYQARLQKRGLWAFGGYEQPKAWRKKHKKIFKKRT